MNKRACYQHKWNVNHGKYKNGVINESESCFLEKKNEISPMEKNDRKLLILKILKGHYHG